MMNLSPAYLKWKEETLNEGKQERIQIGEQRGKQEGIQLGRLEAVPILAELGLSVTEIAQRLNLSPEQVAQTLDP